MSEAKSRGFQTAFLCHSHDDRSLVVGVVTLLHEAGWNVYVDWMDASMPSRPNRTTASKIKTKIVDCNYFLFLATKNSMDSRWCPWEIGYADGKKPIDDILIIPTSDGYTSHGSEYLDLYRRIDLSTLNDLIVVNPGASSGEYLRNL
ncbi:MAG: toll/interleukin-1 receptor domain-containing protein [Verrucomicrobiaceae bacterium]|nr:MAG: toll/interleukin-1 receptor domain-containing protein [Verrucomicrobiaceae bacterium]